MNREELLERYAEGKSDFSCENLRHADLNGVNLSYANLSDADLSSADLRGANLSDANLSYANLSYANLRGANLSYADMRGANLSYANLSYADLSDAIGAALALARCSFLPDGDIVGWKKLENGIAKLLIPSSARRSHAASRKCRASEAFVTQLFLSDNIYPYGISQYDRTFLYKEGETVFPKEPFCEDRWDECASGIHFFITREEAEEY